MRNINNELIEFIKNSATQFQTVDTIETYLNNNKYNKLKENETWKLKSGKYYVTRNATSIIAFDIPSKLEDYHFQLCTSHTDSPTFKIKNVSELESNGYLKLNVELYGGAILNTWLDKPLTIAGRVLVKNKNTCKSVNLYIDKDLFIIPNMPIHINNELNKGFQYNIQIDLCPLVSTNNLRKGDFVKYIAKYLNVKSENIISYDLYLVNRQNPTILGFEDEFICAPRLDDLQASFCSLKGLLDSHTNKCINVYACFDNEEVGSLTKQGASSTFLYDVLSRINNCLKYSQEDFYKAISKSFNISFDNAHAIHPNHPEKYDAENKCFINKGVVIKENASQSYTTDAFSRAIFNKVCDSAKVPYQSFANRSDSRGGSTLGNLSNNQVSMNTVDIGLAQLAMHSNFETAGCLDTEYGYKAIKEYYSTNIIINETESFSFK